jgi:hypothetical protein
MMALSGETFSSEVYAFVVVFVLPVNSALNPFMYLKNRIIEKAKSIPLTHKYTMPTLLAWYRHFNKKW